MIASNCIFTKGYNHILLQDLQKTKLYWITKYDYSCIVNNKYCDIVDTLYKNDVILDIDNAPFIQMPLNYYSKSKIHNSIIEINLSINVNFYKSLLQEIQNLGCKFIELHFYSSFNMSILRKILNFIDDSIIESVDILIPYNNEINNLSKLRLKYPRLHWIYVHSTPLNIDISNTFSILYSSESVSNESCGFISPFYFLNNNNIPHFTESQKHNTCLNRKICIDADGEIRNCPAMKKSYGNIKDTTLKEAMEKPGFKDLWFICKDQIDVCKDCEFRHMCTDCRAFIKDPDNIYSQPAKCTYNPYIAKWQGEEGYVPVEECGIYTKEKGFVVNKRKVNKLNKILWGE